MTNTPTIPTDTKKKSDVSHPGMMGDGTEEQNLDERGNPARASKRMSWMPPSETKSQRSSKPRRTFWKGGGVARLCYGVGRGAVEDGVEEATF